jgi:hypothetical protein
MWLHYPLFCKVLHDSSNHSGQKNSLNGCSEVKVGAQMVDKHSGKLPLFMEGWEIGKTQAEHAFETADLSVLETIGDLAAWTRPSAASELLQNYC